MRPIPIGQIAATTISPNDDNTWTEVAPSAAGMKADRLEQVTDWLASRLSDRHFGAQLVVLRGGRVVLDRSVGFTNRDHSRVTPRDRFVAYSLGKPFAALCVHLLDVSWAERAAARPSAVVDRHAASLGVTRAGNS